jgi:hypothetical protein
MIWFCVPNPLVVSPRPMFMTAETPTRIPAFYRLEPFAGMQETLWLFVPER